MPAVWNPQANALFLQILEQPPAEREAFLQQACGADAELAAQVRALVAANDEAGSFLSTPLVDGPPTVEVVAVRPGLQIGPYKLLQQIGEGGFGVVYMAEQSAPVKRRVAVKVIKPGMDTRQVIARFEAERQALAVMDHPNIARVLDAGATESGRPYFVMELVRGTPITDYCDENSLNIRERLELFAAVCQAIQHAHTKGIIHRDIKPSNVLVTRQDGQSVVKVIDFGIAKAMGQQLTDKTLFTSFAQMIGTPLYMSPEQAELSSTDIDTRSDVYSLGVLLYELLTGSTPVSKEQLKQAAIDEIRRIIREDEPPKPSTRISSAEAAPSIAAQRHTEPAKLTRLVRGELDWIVMKALEKDRSRRYETASGFARDVERYLNDEPVQACPPSVAYRFRKFARRNKAALATASLMGLAVLALIVVLAVSNVLITQEKNLKVAALKTAKDNERAANSQKGIAERNAIQAREQEQKAAANEAKAKASELLSRRRYYAAQMNLAMQAWESGQAARVLALLESQRPKIDEDDLRTFEWYYLWRLCQGGLRRRFPAVNHDNSAVLALSPDGLTLASGFGNDVKLWDTHTGQEKATLTGHSTMVNQLAFTLNGTLISNDEVTIRTWDVATNMEKSAPISVSGQGGDWIAASSDGKTLVIDRPVGITLYDLATGQESLVAGSAGTNRFGIVATDASVQRVAACRDNSLIRVWERDGANWRELPSIPELGWFPCLAFSPEGKTLAVSGTLRCYDPATGQLHLTPQGHTGNVLSVGYSADGKTLVSTGHDQTARLWDAATGRQLVCLAHPVIVYGATLSADGKVAATAGGGISVWDTTPPEEAVILAHSAAVFAVALSRDGKTLASAGNDGTKLWDLSQRTVVSSLPPSCDVAFCSDDKALAIFRNLRTIELWSVSGERQNELLGHNALARSLAVAPDGKSLASVCYEPEAILWDLHTRQPRSRLKISGEMSAVAFSLDGKILAAGSQFGAVKLFEAATGRETATLQRYEFASTYVTGLALSRDSALVAAGNREGQVQVWEIATGRLHASLRGHVGTVAGLSFSPDGRTLATASHDRTVKLWDVATGQERFTLQGHQGAVHAVEFTPDGNTLITASEDGTVRLWLAASDDRAKARKQELDWDVPGTPAACHERGDAFWQYGHLDQAERAYAEADARLQMLTAAFPDSTELKREMIRSLLTRSTLLDETGRSAEAGSLRERAHAIYDSLPENDQQALLWEFCERGRKLAGIGNQRQAERTYTQAIDLEPADERARSWRRSPNVALGDWGKVALDCSRLIELKPDDAGYWNWRGVAYSRQGLHEKALADYSQATQLSPLEPLFWRNRGTCCSEMGRHAEAAADFSKALELNPQDANILNRRAQAYEKLGQQEQAHADRMAALEALKKSLASRPGGDSWDWFLLAAVHWRLGNKDLARKAFQQAVLRMGQSQQPADALRRLRGETAALLELTDPPLAIESSPLLSAGSDTESSLRQAIELAPDLPDLNQQLGTLLAGQGKFAEAEPFLAAAVRLVPERLEGYTQLADVLRRLKKFDEAIEILRQAITRDSSKAWLHESLGWALWEHPEHADVEPAFREAVRLDPGLANAQFGLGIALQAQRKFEESIEPLRISVRLMPESRYALHALGASCNELKHFAEAETALQKVIRLAPDDAEAHHNLGWALWGLKKYAEAEASSREALRLAPQHRWAPQVLADALMAQGKMAAAESVLAEMVKREPENVDWLARFGDVLRQQQKFAEAEAALRKAIALDPARPWTHDTLGWLLREQAKFAEAELEFREAVRLQPDLASSHFGLGWSLEAQKKFADAVGPLREALRLDGSQIHIHGHLGWIFIEQKSFPEAEAAFHEQIRLAPDLPDGHFGLGKALMVQKRFAEAVVPLRDALRLDPTQSHVHGHLGWVLIEQKSITAAEGEFREQIRLSPEQSDGHVGLGKALQLQKKFPEAEAALREAIRLAPSDLHAHRALGRTCIEQKKLTEAETAFREVIRLAPDDAEGRQGLGRALVEQKKFAEAEASIREVLRLDPQHRWAPNLLKRALLGQGKQAEADAVKLPPNEPAPEEAKP